VATSTYSSLPYPVSTDQLVDYPATAQTFANLVDALPNRNAIINGGFDIWQRGTSFSNPATGAYTADRWLVEHDKSAGTISVTRTAQTVGTLIGGYNPPYYCSFAGSGITATKQKIKQRIEGVRTFAGDTITVSFYASADAARNVKVTLAQVFGTGGSPSATVTTTVANAQAITTTMTRYQFTLTCPSISGKTIGTAGDDYLELAFDMGSTATWTLNLWGVQVEARAAATRFDRVAIGDELRRCQRYYYRLTPGNGVHYGFGMSISTTTAYFGVPFPVSMRVVPTSIETTGSTADYNAWTSAGSTAASTAVPTFWKASTASAFSYLTTSSQTAGYACTCIASTATSYLGWSAEL
jgi:hypothetical protein